MQLTISRACKVLQRIRRSPANEDRPEIVNNQGWLRDGLPILPSGIVYQRDDYGQDG